MDDIRDQYYFINLLDLNIHRIKCEKGHYPTLNELNGTEIEALQYIKIKYFDKIPLPGVLHTYLGSYFDQVLLAKEALRVINENP